MAEDTDVQTTDGAESAESAKIPRSTAEQAASALKRARKSAGPEFNDNPDQVQFMLKQAQILALLAIAEQMGDRQAASTS